METHFMVSSDLYQLKELGVSPDKANSLQDFVALSHDGSTLEWQKEHVQTVVHSRKTLLF